MKAVADTLGVARSHLAEQAKRLSSDSPSSRGSYSKAADEAVLPACAGWWMSDPPMAIAASRRF